MEHEQLFKHALLNMDIKLSDMQYEKFYKYMDLLISFNKKFNLTAITEKNEIVIKHFADCLAAHKYLNSDAYVIDVGTGAGFPGIPLKIMYPDMKLTLIEATRKKTVFLNEVSQNLMLKNIQIVNGRSEELAKDNRYREKFDFCVTRAVANLRVLSELTIPFVKKGGSVIAFKGKNFESEISESLDTIKILGGEISAKIQYSLTGADKHVLILINKKYNTPTQYPRIMSKISKCPINV